MANAEPFGSSGVYGFPLLSVNLTEFPDCVNIEFRSNERVRELLPLRQPLLLARFDTFGSSNRKMFLSATVSQRRSGALSNR